MPERCHSCGRVSYYYCLPCQREIKEPGRWPSGLQCPVCLEEDVEVRWREPTEAEIAEYWSAHNMASTHDNSDKMLRCPRYREAEPDA